MGNCRNQAITLTTEIGQREFRLAAHPKVEDLERAARRCASLWRDCQARLIANTMRQSGDKTDIEPLGK